MNHSAKRSNLRLLCLALLTGLAPAAQSMAFAEAFLAARQNDAQYRAAGHELEAARMGVPVARAALMPNVNLSAATSEVEGWRKSRNSQNQDMRLRLEYNAPQVALGVRMPIYNRELGRRVELAGAQAEVAERQYLVRGNELVDRLASAYLLLLLVEESRLQLDQLVISLTQQLTQTRQRMERGEATKVDVARMQSDLDLAKVRVLETANELQIARRQLQKMTGVPLTSHLRLPTSFAPPVLEPEGLFEWLSLAQRNSPGLQAREQTLEVAKIAVQRNRAAHLPRLDLVASLSQNENESVSNLGQTTTQRSIGVQLSVPIFSGGGVEASVKQALSDRARVEEEIRQERENVEIEVQRQYQLTTNGVERIKAHEQAVASAELTVTGMRRAFDTGLGTASDVADALTRAHAARRELAQARIDYVLARTRLMLQAGQPVADVAQEIDRLLGMSSSSEPASVSNKN